MGIEAVMEDAGSSSSTRKSPSRCDRGGLRQPAGARDCCGPGLQSLSENSSAEESAAKAGLILQILCGSVDISSDADGCCSPRLQTRGFCVPLATKPSPLKRRATTSAPPDEQKITGSQRMSTEPSYVVAQATTYKDSQVLKQTPQTR